jgi:hypothetical protein
MLSELFSDEQLHKHIATPGIVGGRTESGERYSTVVESIKTRTISVLSRD